ncbi:MAG TPA: hypothetical protein VNJ70_14240 [Thermoanaerobaculia bacterium]|nr:hypothetical protein [Thermoanaerobaculia bacterium]
MIEDLTFTSETIAVGVLPVALDVNTITNRVYVVDFGSDDVTVIDRATNATETVSVGDDPVAVAVNPVTNKIYVASKADSTVTVIDGATNATETIDVGLGPVALAVNTTTNKIFVAGENALTVIDGLANTTIAVGLEKRANSIAVDSVSNEIYVGLEGPQEGRCAIVYFDGTNLFNSGFLSHCDAGSLLGAPGAIVANPVTHDLYAALHHTPGGAWDTAYTSFPRGMSLTYFQPSVAESVYAVAADPHNQYWYAVLGETFTRMDVVSHFHHGAWRGGTYFAVAANPTTGNVFVSGYGPAPYENNVLVISSGTDLAVTGSVVPDPATTGAELTYNLTVMNHGGGFRSASDVLITDVLAPGLSATSCTTTAGACGGSTSVPSVSLDSLAVGSSVSVTLQAAIACMVADGTILTSIASVAATQSDPNPETNSASVTIAAVNPSPVFTGLSANPAALWPSDNKMRDVTVSYELSDNCALPANACTLAVTSSNPPAGTAPDWIVVDAHHVRLRAARSKGSLERTYTIAVTCEDSGGSTAQQSVQVRVAKP